MTNNYDDYWQRIKLREEFGKIAKIPVKRWYYSEDLNEVEKVYFDEMKDLGTILEIGSGTNSLQKKFLQCGFEGSYHTMDLSREFPHEYNSLEEIKETYDGIMILEVIEHMSLEEFMKVVDFIDAHLASNGKVILSTSHAASVIPWGSWDMTHVQQYPLHDLYTLFRKRGYLAKCYRVWCQKPHPPIRERIRLFMRKVLCYILGIDHVDSVALIAQKEKRPDSTDLREPVSVGAVSNSKLAESSGSATK